VVTAIKGRKQLSMLNVDDTGRVHREDDPRRKDRNKQ
jgi:hypothetical protein